METTFVVGRYCECVHECVQRVSVFVHILGYHYIDCVSETMPMMVSINIRLLVMDGIVDVSKYVFF